MANFNFTRYLPLDILEAKVQNRVAKLLAQKEFLVNATYSSEKLISSRARQLLKEQKLLEGQLPSVLQDIKNKKSDISTLINNTLFYYDMEKHINDVEKFKKGVKPSSNINLTGVLLSKDMLKYGLFGIGILMLMRKPTLFGATTTAIGGYLMSTSIGEDKKI